MSDAAVATIVSGVVTVVTLSIGFLTLWIKLRYGANQAEKAATKAEIVENKLDINTKITKAGIKCADDNAKAAVGAAVEARAATESMAQDVARKLNGGIDDAVEKAVAPVREMMLRHKEISESHERSLEEIAISIDRRMSNLEQVQRESEREIRNAISAQSDKIDTIYQAIRAEFPHHLPNQTNEAC